MFTVQPTLFAVALDALRPTQISVGLAEVERKRKAWSRLKASERRRAMEQQLFPVVKGPRGRLFIIDHHYIALSLLLEGCTAARGGLVKDLSGLDMQAFWDYLDHMSWSHCYGEHGRLRSHRELPRHFGEMKGDPFRSFAGEVRDAGGFSKPDEPFREFLWANYFRERITAKALRVDHARSLRHALKMARSADAAHLPGWSGSK